MPKNTMNISIKLPAYQTKDQRERAKLQIRLALVNLEKKTLKLVRSIMKLTLKKNSILRLEKHYNKVSIMFKVNLYF